MGQFQIPKHAQFNLKQPIEKQTGKWFSRRACMFQKHLTQISSHLEIMQ